MNLQILRPLLSVLVVKFDEGLEIVSSSMSAALPLWSNFSVTQLVIFRSHTFYNENFMSSIGYIR